jgi:polyhydroxyalkanoate synthesis regulator phasin
MSEATIAPEAGETELAKAMLQQQVEAMLGAMKQIEDVVRRTLSAMNGRIDELAARVDHLQNKDRPK